MRSGVFKRSKSKMSLHMEQKIKNITGQVLKYNSKNFHRLNKKIDIDWTMSELGKQFLKKKQIKKIIKN